jgi:hypothetical protein
MVSKSGEGVTPWTLGPVLFAMHVSNCASISDIVVYNFPNQLKV